MIAVTVLQLLNTLSVGLVSETLTYTVRRMGFESLLTKSIKWFEDPDHTPPSVVASLSTDTALLNSLIGTI